MKKAYVKPVFLAEEFEATGSVAACVYHVTNNPAQIWEGMYMCARQDGGHAIGGQNGQKGEIQNWWDYATNTKGATDANPKSGTYNDGAYLFTSGSTTCDFVWNSKTDNIKIWTSEQDNLNTAIWDSTKREGGFLTKVWDTFAGFFLGNSADYESHTPVYEERQMFS